MLSPTHMERQLQQKIRKEPLEAQETVPQTDKSSLCYGLRDTSKKPQTSGSRRNGALTNKFVFLYLKK